MDFQLFPDLIRQWIDIRLLTNAMYRDLPGDERENWSELPWNRYQNFYGVLIPVIIHDALFRLHQIPVNTKLRKVASAQGLVTGIFDDLFDRLHLSENRIHALMEAPDYIASWDHLEEYLCQYLLREIYEHFSGNQHLLDKSISGIIQAQELSAQQRKDTEPHMPRTDLSTNDLIHITKEKGAKAVLFYRSCIDQPLMENEKVFLSELGSLFQMTNDINDALKDQKAGENTFMTMGLSLRKINKIFDAQVSQTLESWKLLSPARYHKERFFSRINILVARSLVTLDRYERLVDVTEPFNIGKIPRNKVISGLRIPLELRSWTRHYSSMNEISK